MIKVCIFLHSPPASVLFSWVGYEKEGYRGHQYLLEEGEYHDWRVWGGSDSELRSARVIRAVGCRQKSHSHTQKISLFSIQLLAKTVF